MKTTFQRLHRTALIAFPLMTIVLVLYSLLFGGWPFVLLLLWAISLGLLIVVLLACIVQNAARRWQAGERKQLAFRYVRAAVIVFAVLVVLDFFTERIAWAENMAAALVLGLMGLYEKP